MARFIRPVSKWGRRLAIVPALAMLAVFAIAIPSSALNGFESADGNLANNGTTDWNDFTTCFAQQGELTGSDTSSCPSGFDTLTWIEDRTGNPDDIYSGGVKQDKDCPTTKDGSLGNDGGKTDIARIYLTTSTNTTGDQYLFLAWERVPQSSQTASAHVAYEFNQDVDNACDGNGLVHRKAGDHLIQYDFEGGSGTSTSPHLTLATWLTVADPGDGVCQVSSHTPPCWGDATLISGGDSDAKVDTTDVQQPVHDDLVDANMGVVQFGEAGLNLTNIVGEENVCSFNGLVTGVSRSSGDAGTAQMKDKVGPGAFELPGCVATTGITSTITLNDNATITGFNGQGAGDGIGKLTFTLYKEDVAGTCDPDNDNVVYTDVINPDKDAAGLTSGGPHSTIDEGDNQGGYEAATAGTYWWGISFDGDSTNLPSESLCHEIAQVSYPT